MRPHCFSRFHLPVSLEVPWGTFLRCSGYKPALPSQNQEVIVPSLSIRRFLAGYVQSQRPSGYPQPQLQGHLSSPWEKDAMTPWIFFSSQPLFYHKSHYVTRFCGRFVVQTPPKKVRKIRFFLYCIQDSPISSFHLQKSRLYALIFWFYPLLCKGHLSIFDLCWGDFTTPPSYYIGHLFEIFNHPRGRRGKNALSPPCIGIVALSPPPGAW